MWGRKQALHSYTAAASRHCTVIQPAAGTAQLYSRLQALHSYTAGQQALHSYTAGQQALHSYTVGSRHCTVIQPAAGTAQLYSRKQALYILIYCRQRARYINAVGDGNWTILHTAGIRPTVQKYSVHVQNVPRQTSQLCRKFPVTEHPWLKSPKLQITKIHNVPSYNISQLKKVLNKASSQQQKVPTTKHPA
jgi:hypothetical protein